ncbi:MAG TPA: peptidoglycan-binding protein LysM [Burkholderiaceae bacterium]|nr:peptidoglycan-binding protein LysM [Burkholderiaceae bacterium]
MGLLSFVKEAGEKLFAHKDVEAAASSGAQDKLAQLNQAAADGIKNYIATQNLSAQDLQVGFDGATGVATVSGVASDQATKEKIVLCCGNVTGVASVDDQLTVEAATAEARYYTVVSGDTLSKISKSEYGDANKYPAIFEANRPMLSSPDRIYPGQVLRIPPL